MIRIVIIEDEIPARKKLIRFINELKETTEIIAEIDNVEQAIDFFKTEKSVDLIISDIELLDGNAFEIYDQVKISCPIIFTTAYDQFWMNAFETNGIEYLLKPFTLERFQKAWNKFSVLNKSHASDEILLKICQIQKEIQPKSFKERFSVISNKGIYFLETKNIAFFKAEEGVIFAFDDSGKKHLLNKTVLKEIESQLNTNEFFKINRSELVNKKSILKMERYSKNAIALEMKGLENPLITSQSQTADFREWIEK
jgi:DNA-binding LytR/AlgR family response regulator